VLVVVVVVVDVVVVLVVVVVVVDVVVVLVVLVMVVVVVDVVDVLVVVVVIVVVVEVVVVVGIGHNVGRFPIGTDKTTGSALAVFIDPTFVHEVMLLSIFQISANSLVPSVPPTKRSSLLLLTDIILA